MLKTTVYAGLNEKHLPLSHIFEHLLPVDDVAWGGYETFRRWSLARGSVWLGGLILRVYSLEFALRVYRLILFPVCSLFHVCRWRCNPLGFFWLLVPMPLLPLWTTSLEPQAKINTSFLCSRCFISVTESNLYRVSGPRLPIPQFCFCCFYVLIGFVLR